MKNLFLSAVLLLVTIGLNAQSKLAVENQYPGDEKAQKVYQTAVEKQSNDKTSALRTTWVANRPSDNWFISAKVGMGGEISKDNVNVWAPWEWFSDRNGYWHPAAGIAVGKWLSPVWGLRLDLDYGHTQSFDEDGFSNGGSKHSAITANFLINLKNFFGTYNPKAFFNPVLNFGVGTLHTAFPDASSAGWLPFVDGYFNVAEKAGLQFNFRLSDTWNLYIDGQLWALPANFDNQLNRATSTFGNVDLLTIGTLGVTYSFGGNRFIKTPLYDQNEIDALNKEINDLRNRKPYDQAEVDALKKEINDLKKRPEKQCPPAAVETNFQNVFFTIGSDKVRDSQLVNVAIAAEFLISHPDSKLQIEGYADSATGTAKLNQKLSEKRAASVAKLLVDKFGIAKDRITTQGFGGTDKFGPNVDQNRVALFIK
ncbi:MAG: OmpA family protein [Candidatus Symbiothrix sp.]|jgi:outer membrane protein OmpA-like peptidoglycan-associated protein|nr:OmpA family protein [Candidatus Symbiothrix sp.]